MTKKKKKQVNTAPGESPFRKGQGSDESYNIPQYQQQIDDAFGQFQTLSGPEGTEGSIMGNLWADAENKMNIGDHFGGVKTDFDNQYANVTNTFGGLKNQYGGVKDQYSGLEDRYSGLENRFAGMENTMEDLTVNTQAADFQREMSQQGAANTMQTFRGAAGSSGIAGLAQAMANQQSTSARQISADIGQQESANQRLAAQAGMSIQQMEAQGASAVDLAKAKGASSLDIAKAQGTTTLDLAKAQGAASVDQLRAQGAMTTQLSIAQGGQAADALSSSAQLAQAGGLQAADVATGQGAMEAQKIQLQGAADNRDLMFQAKQGELSFLAGLLQASHGNKDADYKKSDRKLKKNITKIGESISGINIYSFEYKNPIHGHGLFQGVMSDEVPQDAVINNGEYDMVNYNLLDVEFKQL
jgi:hypothetical protein